MIRLARRVDILLKLVASERGFRLFQPHDTTVAEPGKLCFCLPLVLEVGTLLEGQCAPAASRPGRSHRKQAVVLAGLPVPLADSGDQLLYASLQLASCSLKLETFAPGSNA